VSAGDLLQRPRGDDPGPTPLWHARDGVTDHPLAEAIVRRADAEGVAVLEAGPLESVTARGVRAHVDGEVVEIGSLRMWGDLPGGVPVAVRDAVAALQVQARSTMVVRHGARWLGVFGVADTARPAAPAALAALRRMGVKPIVMLTGDNEHVAGMIGREVGVDEIRAHLLPEDKALERMFLSTSLEGGLAVGGLLLAVGAAAGFCAVTGWSPAGFWTLDPRQTLLVAIPAATALCLGGQVVFTSFLLSFLGLGRRNVRTEV